MPQIEFSMQIGFSKTLLSRGKYAEIYTETRNANAAEDALMDNGIKFIYTSFRDKAAESRGMAAGEMEEHAQGRIWLGKDACEKRCGAEFTVRMWLALLKAKGKAEAGDLFNSAIV